ncbi:hypothetical protein [Aquabacterium sp. NJ1]|uniref:hypothetical protein n=1 Tax=Aquabacterium sp. NJ1 TaxID=1538295 RepID=UPI001269BD70|nr:hypothetical protein [Aquabacterium sp. NJ1]
MYKSRQANKSEHIDRSYFHNDPNHSNQSNQSIKNATNSKPPTSSSKIKNTRLPPLIQSGNPPLSKAPKPGQAYHPPCGTDTVQMNPVRGTHIERRTPRPAQINCAMLLFETTMRQGAWAAATAEKGADMKPGTGE